MASTCAWETMVGIWHFADRICADFSLASSNCICLATSMDAGIRPRSQHFSRFRQRVEHQLPGGDRHGACGIDLHADMVELLPLLSRPLHGELFVFGPHRLRGRRFVFSGARTSRLWAPRPARESIFAETRSREVSSGYDTRSTFRQRCLPRGRQSPPANRARQLIPGPARLPVRAPLRSVPGTRTRRRRPLRVCTMRRMLRTVSPSPGCFSSFSASSFSDCSNSWRALEEQLPQFRTALVGTLAHAATSIFW